MISFGIKNILLINYKKTVLFDALITHITTASPHTCIMSNLQPGTSVRLVGLQALARFNGKVGRITEICGDGKVKVELSEGGLVKVNKRNCDEEDDATSLTLSPSLFNSVSPKSRTAYSSRGRSNSPQSVVFDSLKPPSMPPPLPSNDDFKDFSRILGDFTSREKAYSEQLNTITEQSDQRFRDAQAAAQRELDSLRSENSELILQIEKLNSRIRKYESDSAIQSKADLQQQVEEQLSKKREQIIQKERERCEEEFDHKLKIAVQNERMKLEALKRDEWTGLQESFDRQLKTLEESLKRRMNDERNSLLEQHKTEARQLRQQHEEESHSKMDSLRLQFEDLLRKKTENLDTRQVKLQQQHAQELQQAHDKFQSEKHGLSEKTAMRENDMRLEIQQEASQLVKRIADMEKQLGLQQAEFDEAEANWKYRMKEIKTMHSQELNKQSLCNDMLQKDLTESRSENASLRIRIQSLETERSTPPTSSSQQPTLNKMKNIDHFASVRQDLELSFTDEYKRKTRELEASHSTSVAALRNECSVKLSAANGQVDSLQSEIQKLRHNLNVVRGSPAASRVPKSSGIVSLLGTSPPRSPKMRPQLAIPPPTPPSAVKSQSAVVVFSSFNFKGQSHTLPEGGYNISDFSIGKIASLKISPGGMVVLHEHENGEGAVRKLGADCALVSDFNEKGSSITVMFE